MVKNLIALRGRFYNYMESDWKIQNVSTREPNIYSERKNEAKTQSLWGL